MALALGKLNFSCAVIGLTFINRACRQRTGTPKFRGSGCQFPQSILARAQALLWVRDCFVDGKSADSCGRNPNLSVIFVFFSS